MSMAKAVVGGAVGGALGAAVWAAVSYFTNFEIGWIAWGIGALVGAGTAMGAGAAAGPPTGTAAAVIAVLAVLAGKYAAVDLAVRAHLPQMLAQMQSIEVTDESMQIRLADEVVAEFEQAGKPLNWPAGMTVEEADEQADYPPDAWAEMTRRWEAIPIEKREADKAALRDEMRAAAGEFMGGARSRMTLDAFKASFGVFDLLWFGLAVLTAFKLGGAGLSQSSGPPATGA